MFMVVTGRTIILLKKYETVNLRWKFHFVFVILFDLNVACSVLLTD
jgi:hypothetical protein